MIRRVVRQVALAAFLLTTVVTGARADITGGLGPGGVGNTAAPLVITLPANSLATAIKTVQSGAGATSSSTIPNGAFAFNLIDVTGDTIDPTAAPGGSQNVIGFDVGMTTGGTGTKGTHIASAASINVAGTPSSAANYVGSWSFANIAAQLGGGLGTEKGNAYGANPQVFTTSAATHMNSVVGAEIDVTAGAAPLYRYGLNIVNIGASGGTSGSTEDAALAIGGAQALWNYGIDFTNFNGVWPMLSTGTLIGAVTGGTVNYGINISNITCTLLCYVSGGFSDNGAGNTKTFSTTTNAAHTISSAASSTAYEQFEVGATLKWFMGNNSGNAFTLWDQTNSGQVIGATSAGNVSIGESATKKMTVAGQFITGSGTPTIASGACGATTNGTIAGDNQSGKITIASATTTSCAVSFSATFAAAPNAVVLTAASSASAGQVANVYVSALSATGFTVTGTALASTSWYFHVY